MAKSFWVYCRGNKLLKGLACHTGSFAVGEEDGCDVVEVVMARDLSPRMAYNGDREVVGKRVLRTIPSNMKG